MNAIYAKILLGMAEAEVKHLKKLHPEANKQVAERLKEAEGALAALKALVVKG